MIRQQPPLPHGASWGTPARCLASTPCSATMTHRWSTLTASWRRSSSTCERRMTRTCGRSGRRPRRIWLRSFGLSRRLRRSWGASRRARALGQQPRESRPLSVQAPAAGTTRPDTPTIERLLRHPSTTPTCGRRPHHSLNLADPLVVAARLAPAMPQDGGAHQWLRSLVLQSLPHPLPARHRRVRALQQLRHQ